MNTHERLEQLREQVNQMSCSAANAIKTIDELIRILLIEHQVVADRAEFSGNAQTESRAVTPARKSRAE